MLCMRLVGFAPNVRADSNEFFIRRRDKHKEIEWEDYLYFKIQYRFGPSIWLLGYKEKDGRFEHEEVELGRLSKSDLKKFIEWCGYESFGSASSKLIGASVISTGMNFPKVVSEMFKEG